MPQVCRFTAGGRVPAVRPALLLHAVSLIHEEFDSLRPVLKGLFGGSPLGEAFRESCASIVLTSIDHIVGHRVQGHKLDAGRARTDPVTGGAFLYNDNKPNTFLLSTDKGTTTTDLVP